MKNYSVKDGFGQLNGMPIWTTNLVNRNKAHVSPLRGKRIEGAAILRRT
jgi:hypothetical protein